MRRLRFALDLIARALAALAATLLALTLSRSPSEAAQRTFVVAGLDGYGVDDCMAANTCGKWVAEAWCSAHGMARVVAFGSAADITGSIGRAEPAPPQGLMVTCGD